MATPLTDTFTNRWSAAKGNTKYKYDAVGNVTNIDYAASTDVSFKYDALNRVTNMVDAVGTTKYAYAAGGQLWTEDGPFTSDTVTNGYANRLRTSLSLAQPTGSWTNGFAYDAAKRLTNVTSKAGAFNYLLGGASAASPLPKAIALPNTSYITNTYDNVARLTGTWLKKNDHTILNKHEYGYNLGNQRTQQIFTDSSTIAYDYDPIGQLTNANSSINSQDRAYAYDPAWNLTNRWINGSPTSFAVDGLNQLTSGPDGSLTYDDNGNTLTGAGAGVYGPGWTASYDDENRLIELEWPDWWLTAFSYDGLGRLRVMTEYEQYFDGWEYFWIESSVTRYIYDGRRVIQERYGNNTPTVSYTRGLDLSGSLEGAGGIGGLLARSHGYSGGNWSTHNFFHADGNGNITYLVNSSQGLAASYRYDPFGQTISHSGSLADANAYRFSSKEYHYLSGMYYYGDRWYDPNLQRWVNRDPIEEPGFESLRTPQKSRSGVDNNLYTFVGNEPLSMIDPWGLECKCGEKGCHPAPKPDGCSKVPDKPIGSKKADFEPACNAHDICYQTCGSKKSDCDDKFLKDLKAACDKAYPKAGRGRTECNSAADTYWAGVMLLGGPAFEKGQKAACKCNCAE